MRWKDLAYPALAVLIMLASQVVCTLLVASVGFALGSIEPFMLMAASLLLSSIVTIIVLMAWKQYGLQQAFSSIGCNWSNAALATLGVLLVTFAANLATELLQLPNAMEDEFIGMSQMPIGLLAIGVLGPICEEVVFRGGVMRPLLHRGVHVWHAILLSAVLFGLIHMNWAQIPFAIVVGISYGMVYARTQSLVITSFCHIANNLTSVVLMMQWGEESVDMTAQDTFGLPLTLALTLVSTAAGAGLLWLFWRRTEQVGQAPSPTPTF